MIVSLQRARLVEHNKIREINKNKNIKDSSKISLSKKLLHIEKISITFAFKFSD